MTRGGGGPCSDVSHVASGSSNHLPNILKRWKLLQIDLPEHQQNGDSSDSRYPHAQSIIL